MCDFRGNDDDDDGYEMRMGSFCSGGPGSVLGRKADYYNRCLEYLVIDIHGVDLAQCVFYCSAFPVFNEV